MTINMTQHPATPEQRAAGVVDLPASSAAELRRLLTFEELPSAEEILGRARAIAEVAVAQGASAAMIGGALWLMAPLARELRARGIEPLFAFSRREVVEEAQPDGTVKKTTVFRHAGFVPAV